MDFLTLIQIVKRSWWIVILALVGVFASTALFTFTQTPIYHAITTLVIATDQSVTDVNDIVRSLDSLDRRTFVATYAKIPSSHTVISRAQRQLKLTPTQLQLYQVSTLVVPDTMILAVSVEGPDAGLTAALANAVAEEAKNYAKEFYGTYRLRVLDPAAQPPHPARPEIPRNLMTGALLGLLLGVGLVFLREYIRHLRQTLTDQPEPESPAEELYSLPSKDR